MQTYFENGIVKYREASGVKEYEEQCYVKKQAENVQNRHKSTADTAEKENVKKMYDCHSANDQIVHQQTLFKKFL